MSEPALGTNLIFDEEVDRSLPGAPIVLGGPPLARSGELVPRSTKLLIDVLFDLNGLPSTRPGVRSHRWLPVGLRTGVGSG